MSGIGKIGGPGESQPDEIITPVQGSLPSATASAATATRPANSGELHRLDDDIIKLDDLQRTEFLQVAEKACTEFNGIDATNLAAKANVLRRHFTEMPLYSSNKSFRGLINKLIEDTEHGFYDNTRAESDRLIQLGFNAMIGVFHVPYFSGFEKPSLAALTFSSQAMDPWTIPEKYPSNAWALKDTRGTGLWEEDRLGKVAIFPEMWVSKIKDNPKSLAYYMVDRFVERIHKFTQPALESCIDARSFPLIWNHIDNDNALRNAVFVWLSLHEHNHAGGLVPRVQRNGTAVKNAKSGYKLKDGREEGAFEELKVDVQALCTLFADKSLQGNKKTTSKNKAIALARELILLERLLRYPLQKHPKEGFDAITSHMLLNYLFEKEALYFKDGRLALQKDMIQPALISLNKEFESIEREISTLNLGSETQTSEAENQMPEAKAKIKAFVRKWACRHQKNDKDLQTKISDGTFKFKKDYPMHPFYDFAKSGKTKTDKQGWDAAIAKLCKDDLAVYGSELDGSGFIRYLEGLNRDSSSLRQVGDDYLSELVGKDLAKIDDIDFKLIYLLNKLEIKRDGLSEQEKIDIQTIIRGRLPKPIKNLDERFLSRVEKVLKHRIDKYKSAGNNSSFDDLLKKGESRYALWKRAQVVQPFKDTVVDLVGGGAAIAALLASVLWGISGESNPAPHAPTKDTQKVQDVIRIHEPVVKPFSMSSRLFGTLHQGNLTLAPGALSHQTIRLNDAQEEALKKLVGAVTKEAVERKMIRASAPIRVSVSNNMSPELTWVTGTLEKPYFTIPSSVFESAMNNTLTYPLGLLDRINHQ